LTFSTNLRLQKSKVQWPVSPARTVTVTDTLVSAILTDIHGNGSFKIVVGPVLAGTYDVGDMRIFRPL
jgi:hypothetical protein